LWCGSWSSIFIIKHTVIKLSWHTNNHVIKVWIEGFSFGNFHSIWSLIVISCHNIVHVVDTTWSQSYFSEISWPNTSISIFSLILRIIDRVNSIMWKSVSVFPLLVVVLFKVMMSWVDLELWNHGSQFQLFIGSIQQNIIFLVYYTVAIGTGFREDLKSSSHTCTIKLS